MGGIGIETIERIKPKFRTSQYYCGLLRIEEDQIK